MRTIASTGLLVTLGLFSQAHQPVQAALVTLSGSGFDVIYDDTLLGQFGMPTLSANGKTVLFNPTGFLALSTGTQGSVINAGAVRFDIVPTSGHRVASVSVTEAGDYKVVRRANGLAPAVDVSAELRLTNLYDGISFTQSFLTLAQPLNNVCTATSCLPTAWTATGGINAPLNWSDGSGPESPPAGAPAVRFFLQDVLTAESFAIGDSAFIQKKQVAQSIVVDIGVQGEGEPAVVPLPAALPLLGSSLGLLYLLGRGRRRSDGASPRQRASLINPNPEELSQ